MDYDENILDDCVNYQDDIHPQDPRTEEEIAIDKCYHIKDVTIRIIIVCSLSMTMIASSIVITLPIIIV